MEERHEIRWGGYAGLAYAVTALAGYFMAGNPPRVDDSTAQIAGYFADNQNQVLAQTLLSCVAAVCLVAFAAALAQALRDRMPGSDVPWVVITGVVLVAGLLFAGANLFGALAYLEATGNTLTTTFTIGQLMFTTIGIAAALPLTAASVGISASGILPRWTAWFAALAAVMGVVGAFGIFNQDGALTPGGPVMTLVPFLVSTAWVVVASAYMVREHLPTVSAVPQAMGHA
ncbi:MAG: DUF4386 family protein [Actinomycetes bacterium]